MSRYRAFTLTEMLVNVVILAVLLVLLLPAIAMLRRSDLRMQNNDRVRGILAACIAYAMHTDDFPGLGKDETIYTTPGSEWHTVNRRFQILIDGQFFTAEYLISPAETSKTPKSQLAATPASATDHFSYALLYIKEGQGRQWEWEATLNSRAATVFDRNVPAGSQPDAFFGPEARSIHSYRRWCGSVAYNDNHVVFEPNNVLGKPTQYHKVVNPAGTDDLFANEMGGNPDVDGYNAYGAYD